VRRTGILAVLVFVLVSAAVACGGGDEWVPPPPTDDTNGELPTSPELSPDLVISAIEVFPSQPQSGQSFALNVYVANQGQASSGEYDVAINIKDISHGSTYPIGTFRRGAMHVGESYCVYSSTNVLVNSPGSYQVNAEIIPFLFDDGNTWNNSVSKPFTAK
jgi:hypothetical protein